MAQTVSKLSICKTYTEKHKTQISYVDTRVSQILSANMVFSIDIGKAGCVKKNKMFVPTTNNITIGVIN